MPQIPFTMIYYLQDYRKKSTRKIPEKSAEPQNFKEVF